MTPNQGCVEGKSVRLGIWASGVQVLPETYRTTLGWAFIPPSPPPSSLSLSHKALVSVKSEEGASVRDRSGKHRSQIKTNVYNSENLFLSPSQFLSTFPVAPGL